jgi:hypothetical protein
MADLENGGSLSHTRLPKLEVRKFDGKIHKWQEFWTALKALSITIHSYLT